MSDCEFVGGQGFSIAFLPFAGVKEQRGFEGRDLVKKNVNQWRYFK